MNILINIVLSSDNNYAQHVAVVMASIVSNTKNSNNIRFFLLSDNISKEKLVLIERTVKKFNSNVIIVDLSNNELFSKVFLSGHISKAAYFRLAIADILPKNIDKVIYLDVDLLVLKDIETLWNIDLGGKAIGAVPDYGILSSKRVMKEKFESIGISESDLYFNSGVLILDLKKFRDNNYTNILLSYMKNNKFIHHDQDVLNKVFKNNWKVLPLCWNVIPPVFYLFFKVLKNKIFRNKAIEAKLNPAIFHYAGGYKPWEYKVYQGFNDKYYEYLSLTEFRAAVVPQFDKRRKNRSIKRQLWRLKLANFWCKVIKIY